MANEKSITISYEPIMFTGQTMEMVDQHCKKYGRAAVRTMSDDAPLRTETFECK